MPETTPGRATGQGAHERHEHMQDWNTRMSTIVRRVERAITLVLVGLMSVVLVLATIELGWVILQDAFTQPVLLLEIEELLDIFGLFMLVVIGIELLETITKTYAAEHVDRIEVVLAVAIIAIVRKVIILDTKELSGAALLGIAAIIAALAVSYFLLRRSHQVGGDVQYTAERRDRSAAKAVEDRHQD